MPSKIGSQPHGPETQQHGDGQGGANPARQFQIAGDPPQKQEQDRGRGLGQIGKSSRRNPCLRRGTGHACTLLNNERPMPSLAKMKGGKPRLCLFNPSATWAGACECAVFSSMQP